jgi:multisubunit Na+/H+ antiporter MnhE subunit
MKYTPSVKAILTAEINDATLTRYINQQRQPKSHRNKIKYTHRQSKPHPHHRNQSRNTYKLHQSTTPAQIAQKHNKIHPVSQAILTAAINHATLTRYNNQQRQPKSQRNTIKYTPSVKAILTAAINHATLTRYNNQQRQPKSQRNTIKYTPSVKAILSAAINHATLTRYINQQRQPKSQRQTIKYTPSVKAILTAAINHATLTRYINQQRQPKSQRNKIKYTPQSKPSSPPQSITPHLPATSINNASPNRRETQ